jgi:hypothetical protein
MAAHLILANTMDEERKRERRNKIILAVVFGSLIFLLMAAMFAIDYFGEPQIDAQHRAHAADE